MLARRLSMGIGFCVAAASCRAVHGRRTRRMCTARARSSWRSKETSWKSNSNRGPRHRRLRKHAEDSQATCRGGKRRGRPEEGRGAVPPDARRGLASSRRRKSKRRSRNPVTKRSTKGSTSTRRRGTFGVSRPLPFPLRAARTSEGRGSAAVRFVPYDAGSRGQRYPSGRPTSGEPETGREPLRFLTPAGTCPACMIRLADIRFRWRSRDPPVLDIPELVVESGETLFVKGRAAVERPRCSTSWAGWSSRRPARSRSWGPRWPVCGAGRAMRFAPTISASCSRCSTWSPICADRKRAAAVPVFGAAKGTGRRPA